MLPSKLLYQNKIESSYARNFISKIQPQNTSNFGLGQTTIINIPCMSNQVLSGVDSVLNVRLPLRNTGGILAADGAKLDGAGIISAIARVRIFHGSQLLSDIDGYGNLMNLLYSAQCSSDLMKNKLAILMGSGQEGAGISLNPAEVAADGALTEQQFSIPLMTIFNLTNNYVPCWALTSSSLRLEIQWASSISQFINFPDTKRLIPVGGAGGTLFNDVSLTCNFMELSDSAMAIIQNSLQGRPVEWVVSNWANYIFNTTIPDNVVTNISMAVPAKFNSLKSLLFTFRPTGSASGTGTAAGNTFFGSQSLKNSLLEYDARIGSRVVPSDKPNSPSQFYSEFLRAISSVGNLDHETNITRGMYTADAAVAGVSSKFAVGFDLESYSAVDLSKTYQGLNTSTDDIFANFRFGAQGGDRPTRIDAYAFYDQLIICQNGGVTGVSF
jgi:hypothetical protein